MQYEIIMTDIGHTMQRDGEFIVFGDVMFALPNNGRSRISSYGEGPDKQSARHNLIDRAIEHLQREEDFNAEDNWNCNKCNYEWDAWKEGTEDGSCPKCGGFSGTSLNAETFAVDVIHRKDGIEVGDNSMANEYQCGECDSVYDNSSDATICCKCPSCDEPIHEGDCIKYAESFNADVKMDENAFVVVSVLIKQHRPISREYLHDILITKEGNINLSRYAPKEIDDIEQLMR